YETLISHGTKKRYAGKVAWTEELRSQMVVRGYEIRRTDAFDLQSDAQSRVFDRILDRDQEGSIALAKQIVAEVRSGSPPLEDRDKDPIEMLVISRTVKEENRYVNPNSMGNVIAARKLEEMGEEFMPGMKVSWIVTDSKKSPMEVEPYVSGRPFDKRPDWEYYARRVAQTLAYITEVYGWDEKALFTGTQPAQQKSLDSGDFPEDAPASEGHRREGTPRTSPSRSRGSGRRPHSWASLDAMRMPTFSGRPTADRGCARSSARMRDTPRARPSHCRGPAADGPSSRRSVRTANCASGMSQRKF